MVAPMMHPVAYEVTKNTRRFRARLSASKILGSFNVETLIAVLAGIAECTTGKSESILTMAPVTIEVFSSARPAVIAMLSCPDAAKANKATMTRDDALVTFPGTVTHCNKAVTSVRVAWTSVEEISYARRRAEW
jgi:hypothetical protein